MALYKRKVQKQPLDVFCKKGVFKNFTKFAGKHLCQSFFFNKVAGVSLRTTASEGTLRMKLIRSEKTSYFNVMYCILYILSWTKSWLYKFISGINLLIENKNSVWLSDQRYVTETLAMKSLKLGFHYGLTRINKS